MNRANSKNKPLCRFGPGGDFVYELTDEDVKSSGKVSGIDKFLNTVAHLLQAASGEGNLCPHAGERLNPNGHIKFNLEKSNYGKFKSKPSEKDYSKTTADSSANSPMYSQKRLFSDDCPDSKRTRNHPKHRIRTHRRTSKKGSSFQYPGQGTLFELNKTSSRTA
jgi:hypothetical protein